MEMRGIGRQAVIWWVLCAGGLSGCATMAAGNFAITGEAEHDGCPSAGIYLAAKHIFVDPAGGTLYADVVNRTYLLRASGGGVDAMGSFEASSYCPSGRLDEHWLLRGGSKLEGTLESTWPSPGDCSATCTVRFKIHGERLTPAVGH
jgi:hypothetical protein